MSARALIESYADANPRALKFLDVMACYFDEQDNRVHRLVVQDDWYVPAGDDDRLNESPTIETLKKGKVALSDTERAEILKAKAVWHHGAGGAASPAVWKAVVKGKTYYGCNTHRCGQVRTTLKSAIHAFHSIVKETS